MARNRTPKQRREARKRARESRPQRIHVKPSQRGMNFGRLALLSGVKERANAVRFLRFVGVIDDGVIYMSDRLSEWSTIDEMYSRVGRARRSRLEAGKLKAFRHKLIAQKRAAELEQVR